MPSIAYFYFKNLSFHIFINEHTSSLPKQECKPEVPLHILFIRGVRIGTLNTFQNKWRSYETVIKLTLINYSYISTCFLTPLTNPYSNLMFYKDSWKSDVNVYYTVLLFANDDDNFIYV